MTTRTVRWSLGAMFAALAGCQASDSAAPTSSPTSLPTSDVEQLATGSFCNVDLPTRTPFIPGTTQIAYALPVDSTGYVVVQDWVNGGFIAALADLGQGKITVAYSMKDSQVPLFMYYQSLRGRIIVPNTPPGPVPGGNKGLARYLMELELQTTDASKIALAGANACP